MCIFSGDVTSVGGTKIFANLRPGRQALVYSMSIDAPDELAMILPVPVPAGTPEDAVRFVGLDGYNEFFGDLARGGYVSGRREDPFAAGGAVPLGAPLRVQTVGSFDASFVPTAADVERVDTRFQLPRATWDALVSGRGEAPDYRDWGFCVFKLRRGAYNVHPMALVFPTRFTDRAYFPTVHVHDGQLVTQANFDHTLYLQVGDREPTHMEPGVDLPASWAWKCSSRAAREFMDLERAKGLVDPSAPCWRIVVQNDYRNVDVYAAVPATLE